jgi:hypothetical protein
MTIFIQNRMTESMRMADQVCAFVCACMRLCMSIRAGFCAFNKVERGEREKADKFVSDIY